MYIVTFTDKQKQTGTTATFNLIADAQTHFLQVLRLNGGANLEQEVRRIFDGAEATGNSDNLADLTVENDRVKIHYEQPTVPEGKTHIATESFTVDEPKNE